MAEVIEIGKDGIKKREATPEEAKRQQEHKRKNRMDAEAAKIGSDTENLSPARRRLQALQKSADAPGRIVTVAINGEDWYIRRLNFGELTRLGLLTPRNRDGLLDMSLAQNITSLTAAMLFCCVAADSVGSGDFFETLPEAYEWAENGDNDVRRVVGELFNHILSINPDIVPGSGDNAGAAPQETQAQAEAHEKKGESGASEESANEPSSTRLTDSDASGGTITDSSGGPVSSSGGTGDGAASNATGAAT